MAKQKKSWLVLVVDDEVDVLSTTSDTLMDVTVDGFPLEILTATSASAATVLLRKHPDIAVLLLDVVMEKTHAGLELVNTIREQLKNPGVQILLRTGRPGEAPEQAVLYRYQINDYIDKSSVTRDRVITAVVTAIRAYDLYRTVENASTAALALFEFSKAATDTQSLPQLADLIASKMQAVLPKLLGGAVAFRGSGRIGAPSDDNLTILRANLKHSPDEVETPGLRIALAYSKAATRHDQTESLIYCGHGSLGLVVWACGDSAFDTAQMSVLHSLSTCISVNLQRFQLEQQRTQEFSRALAVVVSRFSTPLASLDLANQYFLGTLDESSIDRAAFFKLLHSNSDSLTSMRKHLDETITNAAVVAGKNSVRYPKTHDIGQLVATAVETERPLWTPLGQVDVQIEPGCYAHVDKAVFDKVFSNLLRNAVTAVQLRFDPELGHPITVSVKRIDGHIHLMVADNGIGIAKDALPRIFEPFYSTGVNSHGLGLAMVRTSLQHMDGRIDCHSQEGKGTTFVVQFEAIDLTVDA